MVRYGVVSNYILYDNIYRDLSEESEDPYESFPSTRFSGTVKETTMPLTMPLPCAFCLLGQEVSSNLYVEPN